MIIGRGLYLKEYKLYLNNLPPAFDGFRFVFLSDLHGKVYGKNNERLLKLIYSASPDYVLIGGDMVVGGTVKNDGGKHFQISKLSMEVSLSLISELMKKYPVIHAYGNHEEKLEKKMFKEYNKGLSELGVKILDDDMANIFRKEDKIDIYGLTLGQEYYPKLKRKKMSEKFLERKLGKKGENFGILLAHSPLYFNAYEEWGANLTLSGHLHGGIMRLPFIGGVIGPDFFLFPKFSGGLYKDYKSRMIFSCGLGNHAIDIRIFNPPELTAVELRLKENKNGNRG